MIKCETFWANIYVGLRSGYSGRVNHIGKLKKLCQGYVDGVGLGLTITRTEFLYTNGNEPGAIVGLINYPRFPSTPEDIMVHALALAKILKDALGQERVSIMTPAETIMLGDK